MKRFLRALGATAAGVWLGAIITIAIVAQTTFQTMPATGVERPNIVAGRVMAVNFSRFDRLQMICGGLLLLSQIAALSGHRPSRRDLIRLAMIVCACGLMLYSALFMTPKITRMQPMLDAPDSEAAVRKVFAEFHHTAVRISQIIMLLVAAIALEMSWPATRVDPK